MMGNHFLASSIEIVPLYPFSLSKAKSIAFSTSSTDVALTPNDSDFDGRINRKVRIYVVV